MKSETRWTAKTPGSRTYQYGYVLDPNGNRQAEYHNGAKTAYTVGDNNELLTAGSLQFTYDRFGNTATREDTSIGEIWTFGWDYESHLLSIASDNGPGADTHEYDGDSRRMRSKFNAATDWINYIYDESQLGYHALIAEYSLISSTFTLTAVNTWGKGLISAKRGSAARYFHFDALGSTWALTSSSANLTDTYSYSAYGADLTTTGSSTNPFRFIGGWGYVNDSVLGSAFSLYLLGVRYFDSRTGLFISRDQIKSEPPYLYCAANPVLRVDPTGLASCEKVYDECLQRVDNKQNACTQRATNLFRLEVIACKAIHDPVLREACLVAANTALTATLAACYVKYNERLCFMLGTVSGMQGWKRCCTHRCLHRDSRRCDILYLPRCEGYYWSGVD